MSTDAIHTAGIGEQAGIVLFSQWHEFCRLRKTVLGQCDTDSIHDLRVASRRMRATLGLFAPFISGKSVKALSKEIRRVTRELGHVRNIDEAIIYFSASSTPLPALEERLRTVREKEIRTVIKVLKRLPRQDMARMLRKAVAGLSGRSSQDSIDLELPPYLSEISIQRYQAVYDLLAPASMPENRAMLHGLRIAIKKWRYLLETIGQVCGQDYGATLETLKEYQTVLGSLNDMAEFAVLSDSLGLPPEEAKEIKAALERDSEKYLARIIEIAASRPIQYTFLL
jgi:CHAD domain-containing protein